MCSMRVNKVTGGALLGQGTYGCVFGPALACTANDMLQQFPTKTKTVSKVFSLDDDRNIQDEVRVAQLMKKIDPNSEFTVKYYGTCDVDFGKVPETIAKKCDAVNLRRYKTSNVKVPQIIFENGGVDLDYLCDIYATNSRIWFDDVIMSVIPIMKGIATMSEKHLAHFDIKPPNMLYNLKTSRMYLVDFGLARKITGLHLKNIAFMLAASYLYYPLEFRIMSRILNGISLEGVHTQFMNDTKNNSRYAERYASIADKVSSPFLQTLKFLERDMRAMVTRAQQDPVAFEKAFKKTYLYKTDVYSFGISMMEIIYQLSHNTKGIAFRVKNQAFVHQFQEILRDMIAVDPEKRLSAQDAYNRASALTTIVAPNINALSENTATNTKQVVKTPKKKTTCPAPRRPDSEGKCPPGSAARPNKHGQPCCYKVKKTATNTNQQ